MKGLLYLALVLIVAMFVVWPLMNLVFGTVYNLAKVAVAVIISLFVVVFVARAIRRRSI